MLLFVHELPANWPAITGVDLCYKNVQKRCKAQIRRNVFKINYLIVVPDSDLN